jgi:hypothetical protein
MCLKTTSISFMTCFILRQYDQDFQTTTIDLSIMNSLFKLSQAWKWSQLKEF